MCVFDCRFWPPTCSSEMAGAPRFFLSRMERRPLISALFAYTRDSVRTSSPQCFSTHAHANLHNGNTTLNIDSIRLKISHGCNRPPFPVRPHDCLCSLALSFALSLFSFSKSKAPTHCHILLMHTAPTRSSPEETHMPHLSLTVAYHYNKQQSIKQAPPPPRLKCPSFFLTPAPSPAAAVSPVPARQRQERRTRRRLPLSWPAPIGRRRARTPCRHR